MKCLNERFSRREVFYSVSLFAFFFSFFFYDVDVFKFLNETLEEKIYIYIWSTTASHIKRC
jgi:hypothetical protein